MNFCYQKGLLQFVLRPVLHILCLPKMNTHTHTSLLLLQHIFPQWLVVTEGFKDWYIFLLYCFSEKDHNDKREWHNINSFAL